MPLDNLYVSSAQFWMSAGITAIVDVIFILVLAWRIKPAHFRDLKWLLVGTAALFWGLFSVWLVQLFWDAYYQAFYPPWFRSGGILLYVPLVYGLFAWAFHWLALRLPGYPVVTFSLLCGAESLIEHVWGLYGFKILQVPLLQQASPASVLAFSFPEYILYWCIVISVAALIQGGLQRLRKSGKASRNIGSRWA